MAMRRNAIITGSNAGIGFETACELASRGFHCVLACRSIPRGEEAAASLRERHPSASVQVMELNLSDFSSVLLFAKRAIEELGALHILVNNAGIGGMGFVYRPLADGTDEVYRVNFVAHFLLTLLLHESLCRGAQESESTARVVCLSSVIHREGAPPATHETPACAPLAKRGSNAESAATPWTGVADWETPLVHSPMQRTYGTSKLAMAVFAAEITRRWQSRGVVGIAVNPGAVNSDIWYRGQLSRWQERLVRATFLTLFLTSKQVRSPPLHTSTGLRPRPCPHLLPST